MNIYFWRNKVAKIARRVEGKNLFLYCLGRLVKNVNNPHTLEQMAEAGRNTDEFSVKHFGEKNKDKNIFLILMDTPGRGLGAYLHMLASALYLAERFGFVPVVYFGEKCMYFDAGIKETNPFEYYFCPVSDVSFEDAKESSNVFLYREAHFEHCARLILGNERMNRWSGYNSDYDYLQTLARVVGKYLELNRTTRNYIDTDELKLWGSKNMNRVLGIHIRGTDFKAGWENHPLAVYPEEYFPIIDEALKTQFDYIFLATDDTEYLEMFNKRYGDRLGYYKDVHREAGNVSVAMKSTGNYREHYRNGLEVLRDIYTLSHCGGLVAGKSQVSFCAQLFRLSKGVPFSFIKILDKGIKE